MIQQHPGNLAAAVAGPGWEDPAAGRRGTGPTVGQRFGNKKVESVGGPAVGLAVAPGIAGACGSADKVVLPGGVGQNLAEGGVALGKVSGQAVGLVEAGYKGFVAGSGEGPGLTAHNMGLGLGGHNLLVPVVHMSPSKTETHKSSHITEANTNKDDRYGEDYG